MRKHLLKTAGRIPSYCKKNIARFWEIPEMVIFRSYKTPMDMGKRITIVIDDDLDKKLRLRQAKIIQHKSSSCSFSRVINECIRKSLK